MARPPFPSNHPLVKNPDGSSSNVLTATFEMSGTHYVIPTMVEGKRLSGKEAVAVAKAYGLDRYPSFKTAEEALGHSKKIHGKQPTPERTKPFWMRGKERTPMADPKTLAPPSPMEDKQRQEAARRLFYQFLGPHEGTTLFEKAEQGRTEAGLPAEKITFRQAAALAMVQRGDNEQAKVFLSGEADNIIEARLRDIQRTPSGTVSVEAPDPHAGMANLGREVWGKEARPVKYWQEGKRGKAIAVGLAQASTAGVMGFLFAALAPWVAAGTGAHLLKGAGRPQVVRPMGLQAPDLVGRPAALDYGVGGGFMGAVGAHRGGMYTKEGIEETLNAQRRERARADFIRRSVENR